MRCRLCKTRPPSPGYLSCKACREADRERQRSWRDTLTRRGMCIRCTRGKREKPNKLCRACLDAVAAEATELQESRRTAGLCPTCGGERAVKKLPDGTITFMVHCERHLAAFRKLARKRAPSRASDPDAPRRVQQWKLRQRALGNCITCGEPAYYDPVADVVRGMCREHLDKAKQRRARQT